MQYTWPCMLEGACGRGSSTCSVRSVPPPIRVGSAKLVGSGLVAALLTNGKSGTRNKAMASSVLPCRADRPVQHHHCGSCGTNICTNIFQWFVYIQRTSPSTTQWMRSMLRPAKYFQVQMFEVSLPKCDCSRAQTLDHASIMHVSTFNGNDTHVSMARVRQIAPVHCHS